MAFIDFFISTKKIKKNENYTNQISLIIGIN